MAGPELFAPEVFPEIFTIGHSTREIEAFIALLARESVRRLVDVRLFPASRRYPHFNSDALARSLADAGIAYRHAKELGGRRKPLRDSPNTGWRNDSFRGYADYMLSDEFRSAIALLIAEAADRPTAIMCAEAVPWRCHRNLVSDALVARGLRVRHILEAKTSDHVLARFARVTDRSDVIYDVLPQTELFRGVPAAG